LKAVWDVPVRLVHWLLAGAIAAAWATSDQTGAAHEYIGYMAGVLVALRVVWGFVGNRYARFEHFLRPPSVTLRYLRQVLSTSAPRHIGHNPLGGWMAMLLWSSVGLLTATGWALTTDLLWGYAWPILIHAAIAWAMLALIVLHVAGVLLTTLQHRENLVVAMVTGKKVEPQAGDVD
jgi:cytochrome b